MKNSQTINWAVDATLFIGFCLASLLDLTGLALHQWLGLAVGMLAIYHLLFHWSWICSVTQRWFGRTTRKVRGFYLLDAGLFAGFVTILYTGLVISTWFDLTLTSYAAWRSLHVIATVVALVLVVIKIGAHWRWAVKTSRQIVSAGLSLAAGSEKLQSVPAQAALGRRDFIKLMGFVSVAALIAAHDALDSQAGVSSLPSSAEQDNASQASTQSETLPGTYGSSTTTGQCFAGCPRGCSYPGRCRRYVDTNNNNRCDLSECA